MMLAKATLLFKLAIFRHSEIKRETFNEVHSLDRPNQTVLYGALANISSQLGYDYSILDKVAITTPKPKSKIVREMFITTAPISSIDWTPKGLLEKKDESGNKIYGALDRIYPRKFFPLNHPSYELLLFAEDSESAKFLERALSMLATKLNGKMGMAIGLGYKKKWLGAFEAYLSPFLELRPISIESMKGDRFATLLAPCNASDQRIAPIDVNEYTLIYRNVHAVPELAKVKVYGEDSLVLVKRDANVAWFDYQIKGERVAIGFSKEIYGTRQVNGYRVKAYQPIFLTKQVSYD
jgi:hypothetical protein